ncbi:uncharacterized protein E0L32_004924 [Thyridium curvatum]|uniref:PH domain-containing protein n=1 Tax=Thyridium curvatum TaxID=1093900 RepID=A0A507B902_9PEZI|nr:uncharacterized protein E0L32_004924 [Thyridium curvatum]TPX15094.1 hypothetical protein E0L32_004924 [Thyridium curvatum]
MVDSDTAVHRLGALEALQNQVGHSRRQRPPDLDRSTSDENRIPLRHGAAEKLNKRESKLGLRGLFSRHKNLSEADVGTSKPGSSRSAGIRASLAEISNWPYGFQSAKSDVALATADTNADDKLSRPAPPPRSKTPTPGLKPARASVANWDPPPLFKAYPQAIKHASLPACTTSADTLLRAHGHKSSFSLRDGLASPEPMEDFMMDYDKSKKKHRRNNNSMSSKLEWTTKLYILVTSGYLLQYAGEGTFDRLPEKILQLGRESAAFASDLIPGKHWVLQISTNMDPDGTQTADSRSLFTRLPFKVGDRRHASNCLMVFENAEDMESWIVTLRREIEHLGGKRSLSETGTPKMEAQAQLRSQVSQRTLVVRDPDRFSRVLPSDAPWQQLSSPVESPVEAAENEGVLDQTFEDVSATNSMISQDGRHLESLRDSAARLSCVSSGQRTFVTSEGSSPPCSPMRNSFASFTDESMHHDLPPEAQARPRPNAAAILDRRQSMRTVNPLVDFRIASNPPPRPQSTYAVQERDFVTGTTPQTTRNFSVPQAVSKRYSLIKSPPLEPIVTSPPAHGRIPPARPPRRPPPPSLGFSRPLSIVADQPSPGTASPTSPRELNGLSDDLSTPESEISNATTVFAGATATRDNDLAAKPTDQPATKPRRPSSLQTLRPVDTKVRVVPEPQKSVAPSPIPIPRAHPRIMPDIAEEPPRCRSSMATYRPGGGSMSPVPASPRDATYKRSSMFAHPSDSFGLSRSHRDLNPRLAAFPQVELPLRNSPPAYGSVPKHVGIHPSHHQLQVHEHDKGLLNRRSMSQLVEGPPPAPPPTCALPPLPPKMADINNVRSRA